MAVTVHLAAYLRAFAGGRGEVMVAQGGTVRDVIETVGREWPGVKDRIIDEAGHVRVHVNVFVGQVHVKELGGLAAPVRDGDHVHVLPAVSGGL